MKRLPPLLWLLKIKANLLKTLYINFHYFPFLTAIKLPIILVGKVHLGSCKTGKIVLRSNPCFAMVVIGRTNLPNVNKSMTAFRIEGTIELSDHIRIMNGCSIHVSKGALLSIGKQVLINVQVRIWCRKKISIGNYCRIAWDCQLFDSNFHFMVDSDGYTKRPTGEITIGDNCWLGNRCTINKGSRLPNYTIVAAGSIVNKDFSECGEACTIGGVPAKYISQGYRRIINCNKEKEISEAFMYPAIDSYYVGTDDSLFHWF